MNKILLKFTSLSDLLVLQKSEKSHSAELDNESLLCLCVVDGFRLAKPIIFAHTNGDQRLFLTT